MANERGKSGSSDRFSLLGLLKHFRQWLQPWNDKTLASWKEGESESLSCVVHGILQARILEWVACPFSRGSYQPRDQTQVSCIAGRFFTNWAIKAMTNLDSILKKSKDITLLATVRIVKAMAFPIVMYGCESWTIKKAEQMLSNCGARGLLRVPWTAR